MANPADEEDTSSPPPRFGGMSADANPPAPDEDAEDTEAAPDDEGAEAEAAPEEGAGDEGAAPQRGQKATPEQQAQYEQFVHQGWTVIYKGGKPLPAIVEQLRAGDPKRGLALAAVTVVKFILQSAKENNVKIDGRVILLAGQRLFEELADVSAMMKIHQFAQGELDAAWVLAMHMAQQQFQAAGLIDPKAFVRDVQEINKAEAEGRLDEVLPGIGKLADEVKQGIAQRKGQNGGQAPADQEDGPPAEGGDPVGAADDASEGAGADMEGAGEENTSDEDGEASSTDAEDEQKPGFGGFGG